MKLYCYPTSGFVPDIRPAPASRDWMDATPERYAYRCLPLNIANSHGWEVLCPMGFSARWDGGTGKQAITITGDQDNPTVLPLSHFGSGVLTFHVHGLFRSEGGVNLWVGGTPNRVKDGIQPLAGIIETDWAPYSFTMNWKFTRPGATIRFEAGEPFCFFFPLVRDMVEAVEPEFCNLADNPELDQQYRAWVAGRTDFLKELPVQGSSAQMQSWQKTYFKGRMPDGRDGTGDHRTKLTLRPFQFPK